MQCFLDFFYSPRQCLYLSVCLFKCLMFRDAASAQNSSIRGNREAGIPAYTQTQRKEECVVNGDEGRVIKARKPLGRMSCDVTHGRGLRACTPEGGLNSKHLRLICGGKKKRRKKKRETLQRKYVKVSLFRLSEAFRSSHYTCSHHTSAPKAHLQNIATCAALWSYLQYTVITHTHTHTHPAVVCPSHTLLVLFVMDTGTPV